MSINLGLGACPMGACAFGFGTPAAASADAAPVFQKPDGTQGDAALIDTRSGDFVLDERGRKVGWDSLSQSVYLALRTTLGTAAVRTMGIELPTGTITADMPARVRRAVAAALKRLVDRRQLELVDVITTRLGPSALRFEVRWRRLSTGQVESTFI